MLALAKVFPSMHPAEIWQLREDVAVVVLAQHAALLRRAPAASIGAASSASAEPAAQMPAAGENVTTTDASGARITRITSMAGLAQIFAGARSG
ncbi:MAG: hypothetical protein WBD40_03585 [Tepidisphaeraceae bacterium]